MHAAPQVRRSWNGLLTLLFLLAGCHAGDPTPGPPQQVIPAIGDHQQASVGTALSVPPSVKVRDSRGTGVPGVVVRFSVGSGGGHITGDSAMTDASGVAAVGSWVLGTVPGANSLVATVDSTAVSGIVAATAVAGPPAAARVVGSQLYTGQAGEPLIPAPKVRIIDSYQNPVPGVTVTFTVLSGDGSISGSSVVTNGLGEAQVGGWTLGAAGGTNRLFATAGNGAGIDFTAIALVGSPKLTTTTPTDQSGYLSFPVTEIPRLRVTDQVGNALPNVVVSFAMTEGDGTVTDATVSTGSDGRVALGDWRLGPAAGSSTVVATLPDFPGPSLTFHATGVPTPFTIDVRFLTSMSADSRDAFVAAARRWMRVIVGDIPDQPITLPAGACATGQPAINETIDDVVIYASVVPIDGPSNILGSAGPCVRRTGSNLTVIGTMRFDEADLALLQNTSRLVPTIVHEMGHVLGFGTSFAPGTTQDIGLADPIYVGASALALWPSFTLSQTYAGRPIPLENTGGPGTRDAHWRENVNGSNSPPLFGAEIMTGTIEAQGVPMPLSKLTIAVFKDMGYQVDFGASDPFSGNLVASPFAVLGPSVPLNDEVHRAQYEVGPDGLPRRIN